MADEHKLAEIIWAALREQPGYFEIESGSIEQVTVDSSYLNMLEVARAVIKAQSDG